jgi:integral membrane protein (TIGR01906 family)
VIKPVSLAVLSWFISLLMSIFLILTGVRLLLTPVFLSIEYNMPGFPEDAYGFNKADRLYWSNNALDYLLNEDGISFLADLRFEDGQSVYNQRELRHMIDVKVVVKYALNVWMFSMVVLIGLGVICYFRGWLTWYWIALSRGGWLTGLLLVSVVIIVLVSFRVFFVAFHNMFFKPGTWTFLYSDTLIRLFPERFWFDAFVLIGLIAILSGIGAGILFQRLAKRSTNKNGF